MSESGLRLMVEFTTILSYLFSLKLHRLLGKKGLVHLYYNERYCDQRISSFKRRRLK